MSKTFEIAQSDTIQNEKYIDVPTIISNLDQNPPPKTHPKQQQIESKGLLIKADLISVNSTLTRDEINKIDR